MANIIEYAFEGQTDVDFDQWDLAGLSAAEAAEFVASHIIEVVQDNAVFCPHEKEPSIILWVLEGECFVRMPLSDIEITYPSEYGGLEPDFCSKALPGVDSCIEYFDGVLLRLKEERAQIVDVLEQVYGAPCT